MTDDLLKKTRIALDPEKPAVVTLVLRPQAVSDLLALGMVAGALGEDGKIEHGTIAEVLSLTLAGHLHHMREHREAEAADKATKAAEPITPDGVQVTFNLSPDLIAALLSRRAIYPWEKNDPQQIGAALLNAAFGRLGISGEAPTPPAMLALAPQPAGSGGRGAANLIVRGGWR